jgi:hypothetical protein
MGRKALYLINWPNDEKIICTAVEIKRTMLIYVSQKAY